MEYFDILNRDGSKSGNVATKGEQLSCGQYYMGAHAYIHNYKGEFILQKRSKTKEFLPSGWDIHMGHVMAGETSEEAIIREVFEEIGMNVEKVTFIKRIVWEKYNHIIDIYVIVEDINLSELILQKSEVEDVKYISRDDMIKLIGKMDYRPEEYRKVMENYVRKI